MYLLFFVLIDFWFLLLWELCFLECSFFLGGIVECWLDWMYSIDNRCFCWVLFLLVFVGEIMLCYKKSYFMSLFKYLIILFWKKKFMFICGMVFKFSELIIENVVLVIWVNFFGFLIVVLIVYFMWLYLFLKEDGMFFGSWNWKG